MTSAQLPFSDAISGKNTSCQDAGAVLSSPVLVMKAASFISPVGATEKTMEPSVSMPITSSRGSREASALR